jgi:hypothetical protein
MDREIRRRQCRGLDVANASLLDERLIAIDRLEEGREGSPEGPFTASRSFPAIIYRTVDKQ